MKNVTDDQIKAVIEEYPSLGVFGFNDKDYEAFFGLKEEISACIDFLNEWGPKIFEYKKGGKSSYWFKHVVENKSRLYIANGVFILASILYGVAIPKEDIPYLRLNIGYKCNRTDLKRIEQYQGV